MNARMLDEQHIRELAERHTFEYKGIRYRVALWRLQDHPPAAAGIEPRSVDLDFSATPITGGDAIRLSLHLGVENAEDDVYVLDAIDETIRKIADGELPPGTRELF